MKEVKKKINNNYSNYFSVLHGKIVIIRTFVQLKNVSRFDEIYERNEEKRNWMSFVGKKSFLLEEFFDWD